MNDRKAAMEIVTAAKFSVGYGGEGPRGMLSFAKIFGIHLDAGKVLGGEEIPDKGLVDLVRAFG